jgi:hypothetical protein
MRKIIEVFILLLIFAPFLALADFGGAVGVSPYPKLNVFDELRSFSAKINSFLIPNYSGDPQRLFEEARGGFLEAMRAVNQWFDKAAVKIKSNIQYAADSLVKIKNYIFEKKPAEDAVNAAKNAINEKLRVFP